ncbi:hypothetical protein BT69DRAFT_1283451 [Atractiella rhizophila]|nr:hypothetical protein BT69DRAFT_1283451 [Atractiella rhizophila]
MSGAPAESSPLEQLEGTLTLQTASLNSLADQINEIKRGLTELNEDQNSLRQDVMELKNDIRDLITLLRDPNRNTTTLLGTDGSTTPILGTTPAEPPRINIPRANSPSALPVAGTTSAFVTVEEDVVPSTPVPRRGDTLPPTYYHINDFVPAPTRAQNPAANANLNCLFEILVRNPDRILRTATLIITLFDTVVPRVAEHFRRLVSQKKYVSCYFTPAAIAADRNLGICTFRDDTHRQWANEETIMSPEENPVRRTKGSVFLFIDGPALATNSFFIPYKTYTPRDNEKYTVVGKVVSGMDVIDELELNKMNSHIRFVVTNCELC